MFVFCLKNSSIRWGLFSSYHLPNHALYDGLSPLTKVATWRAWDWRMVRSLCFLSSYGSSLSMRSFILEAIVRRVSSVNLPSMISNLTPLLRSPKTALSTTICLNSSTISRTRLGLPERSAWRNPA